MPSITITAACLVVLTGLATVAAQGNWIDSRATY